MRLPSLPNIRLPWKREGTPEFKVPPGSVADVYVNPMEYSRAVRRKVGLRRPIHLVSEQHMGLAVPLDPNVPRYARRHLSALNLHGRQPRAKRRARQRILRRVAHMNLGGGRG